MAQKELAQFQVCTEAPSTICMAGQALHRKAPALLLELGDEHEKHRIGSIWVAQNSGGEVTDIMILIVDLVGPRSKAQVPGTVVFFVWGRVGRIFLDSSMLPGYAHSAKYLTTRVRGYSYLVLYHHLESCGGRSNELKWEGIFCNFTCNFGLNVHHVSHNVNL
eukprot:1699580-Rhodomonas_salina.1